ncbi:hypothetical protein EV715DRAFT_274593 [Schizophyllum commune]
MSGTIRSPGRDAWPPFTGQRRDLSGAPQTHGNVSPTGSGNASPYAAGPKYQDANFASRMHPSAMPPPPCFNGGYNNSVPLSSTLATTQQSGVSTPAHASRSQWVNDNTIHATGGSSERTGKFIPPAEDIKAGQEEEAARLARLGLGAQPSARSPLQGAGHAASINRVALARALLTVPIPASY